MMAGGGGGEQRSKGRRKRLLFVVQEHRTDRICVSHLVFKINLKDMFAPGGAAEDCPWPAMTMRSFPDPVAQFDSFPRHLERLDLAIVGTNIVVAVSSNERTLMYDAAAADAPSAGPDHGCYLPGGGVLIPLGTRLYTIGNQLWPPSPSSPPPIFQALQPPASPSGRWSWRALPPPPRDMYSLRPPSPLPSHVTATMAAGARVWLSARKRGTYSFDTARLAWRKEGDWELPFQGRALVVPELQGLCFGICSYWSCLCAFDAPVTGAGHPPPARYVWYEESYPHECVERGFFLPGPCSLAYLGDGNLCITWTMAIDYEDDINMIPSRFALLLMAVQVVGSQDGGELRLLKHGVRCYEMSSYGREGYVLQPSLPC